MTELTISSQPLRAGSGRLPRVALALAVFALGFAVPALLDQGYLLSILNKGLLLGILALGIAFLMHQCGLVLFGIASFYGVGAYGFAILTETGGLPGLPAAILAIALCGAFSFLVGAVIVRTRPLAFMMITLALGELLRHLTSIPELRGITHGVDGMIVNFQGTILGYEVFDFLDPAVFWPFVWTAACGTGLMMWLVANSMVGRTLRAIKENEERMRFCGFGTYLPRLLAFSLAGSIAGIAGVLQALASGFVSPELFGLVTSTNALLAAITGGLASIAGPVLGGVAFAAALDEFGALGYSQLFTGIAVVVVIVAMPRGLVVTLGTILPGLLARFAGKGRDDA